MTIIDYIRSEKLLRRGDRVLCAVSGGADSMCLLHWLSRNAKALGISVCAASFDHMLRGEQSRLDCVFVADRCADWGIPCLTGEADVRKRAEKEHLGEEEAARLCRYEFLESAARSLGCNVIATAHNADDNAETMLFNFTRGGGLKGLCGIPPRRGNIIRPLLNTSRREIEEYDKENSVPFVTDSTNLGDDYTRNILRHRVTPVLEGINPAFFAAASRTAALLREDEYCLDALAREAYDRLYKNSALSAQELLALPKAVGTRLLRLICGRGLEYKHVEALYALAGSTERKYADIAGMRVSCDQGVLRFGETVVSIEPRVLRAGETIYIPEGGFEVKTELLEKTERFFGTVNKFDFNYGSICGSITFMSRRDGDKIRLRGRGCTKSLKDLFNEAGMSRAERELTPVLRDERGPIAVYGFGVAERCAAVSGQRALRVTITERNKSEGTGDN